MKAFLLVCLVVLFSCERSNNNQEECSIQGFNELKRIKLSCKQKLVIHSVDFANGVTRNLIEGSIQLNKVDYPFSIMMDSLEVIKFNAPEFNESMSNYNCNIKKVGKSLFEIEWKKGVNRIFLRKKITLTH